MKKDLFTCITAVILATILMLSLGAASSTMAADHEHVYVDGLCTECGKYEAAFITRIPIKDKYTKAIEETGTLETITYQTPFYGIDESIEVEKVLQVYLPYGYDPAQQYNVMYLMHGGGESEYYWLNDEAVYENTKAMGKTTKAVIDNMVAEGKMEPTIFVASTYETKDKNGNRLTEGDMSGYAQEFRNIIVPLVESTYSTYCAGDVSEENLIATRDHRGFAGFSMGSRCTVDGILMHDLDLVAWYGAYSGPDASLGGGGGVSAEDVKAVMESFGPEMDIKYIYNGDGTADFALEGHQTFAYGLLEVMPESFQDGRNWCWVCFKGGSHAYNCWIVDLYNCMLVFFK